MNPPDETALRRQVIDTALAMGRLGINQGTSGNVSARWSDGLLITPSGVPYDALTPERIVWLPLDVRDDDPLFAARRPSSEWRIHRDVLRSRPEIGAVVHTHSNAATALSIHGRGIPAHHYMVAAAGGNSIRCAPYATFGSQALSDHAIDALRGRSACLLAHHGVLALGANLDRALWLANEVEVLARQYLLAAQLGEPPLLSDAQMDEVIERFKGYGLHR
ncbi:L-fuculose-phosphate aldolase [Paraburkholderia caballeronis]|uniref:L-fuculose-phosphate aldolase n=1 Tax=Paraburkholderia caballeronis TaxID=416943 RepID=A0A1H7V979_9BURK|nr:L-fuculose-phosphate aldolase [Paraburkholderia caballeronis]PXW16468.1 L-fuculose-phosphate aldolase [Paraburkholderia caballeronis]PXW94255.1 L-fuculose-phosphate aldolase [Paraburkholderia caballeronis]RAJ89718.1 L-fuculose-phosphate aldolase [Paraburkholderia caballeronis]SED93089.1 L-fuculose-phosphate aldolase [Paraburkholderia caballeronis]SEM05435.1 L-fuculose-phosphate aldolase [Paraburkholderia caballeronis]